MTKTEKRCTHFRYLHIHGRIIVCTLILALNNYHSEPEAKHFSDDQQKGLLHHFEKGHEKDGSWLLVLALKTKKYAEHCHMGISLIPKYNQFASNTAHHKVLGYINCHYKIQVNLQHCILEAMVNIDKYNETLKSMGCQLLMKMMRPSNLVTSALLAVDTKEWGGDGIILTFLKSYEDVFKDAPYPPPPPPPPPHPRHVVSHLW